MMITGGLVLAGVSWAISHRPGFLPQQWAQSGFRWWHISLGYKVIFGIDCLIAAWAIGWMIIAALSRTSRYLAPLRDSLAVRPSRLALGGLFCLQLILLIIHRPEDTPALVLGYSSLRVGAGIWRWASFTIGGNAASLAFLLCCAAVALWYVSGVFGGKRVELRELPLSASAEGRAKQASRVCLEVVSGLSVLLVVPIVLDTLARALRPPLRLFQDGALNNLWSYLVSPTHLAWPAFALSVAAASWALGWGVVAVVWRVGWPGKGSTRRAEEVRRRVGGKLMTWLLGADLVLAIILRPEENGRFFVQSQTTGWWFNLDLWLALVALVAVAMAVLFVGETFVVWWDQRKKSTISPSVEAQRSKS